MLNPFMRWMHTLPYTDVTVYRQATLLQTMLLAVAALSFAGSVVTLLAPLPRTERTPVYIVDLHHLHGQNIRYYWIQ